MCPGQSPATTNNLARQLDVLVRPRAGPPEPLERNKVCQELGSLSVETSTRLWAPILDEHPQPIHRLIDMRSAERATRRPKGNVDNSRICTGLEQSGPPRRSPQVDAVHNTNNVQNTKAASTKLAERKSKPILSSEDVKHRTEEERNSA
jgi:hypothetical protein